MADVPIGSARTVAERLRLCHNLISLRGMINSDGPNKIKVMVMARRRVAAIRRVLLGRDGVNLADELLLANLAGARLLAALEAVKDKPEPERVATAVYAKDIMRALSLIRDAEESIGLTGTAPAFPPALRDAISALLPASTDYGEDVKPVDPVLFECLERGSFGKELKDELAQAAAGGSEADEQVSKTTRMMAGGYEKALAERNRLENALLSMRSGSEPDEAAILAAQQEYQAFIKEVLTPVAEAHYEVEHAARKRAKNAFATVGTKLITSVMDASPITPDAAAKWAAAQEITPPAVARLRKIGYPLTQVREDVAEFYRFTAGRVTAVRIHSKGDRRANATDIHTHSKVGTIHLDGSFDKRTLWHELAHHMEADPLAKMAAGRFIRRRSVDGQHYSLRSLSGNKGYRSDEVALKGDFFSPYVGKIYRDGTTEVFSMGVESFSDPETLARRAAQDPQTLEFVAGFVRAPMDPLAQAHSALREIMREMQEEATQATGNALDDMLKALADTVELTPDTDTAWIVGQGGYRVESYGWTQLGRFEESGYYVMAGKVRNHQTKRKCSGLVLVKMESHGRMGWREVPGTDQTTIKAMYAIYKKSGTMPALYQMESMDYLKRLIA